MSAQVDVLEVMLADANCAYMDRVETGPALASAAREKSEAARAAIAELIAADREYDEAKAAFDALLPTTAYLTHNAVVERLVAATARRASALAAVGQQS